MFEKGVVRTHKWDIFSINFSHESMLCVFSLESPHRDDSNEYTQHIIINIKKKSTKNYFKYNNSAAMSEGLKNELKKS